MLLVRQMRFTTIYNPPYCDPTTFIFALLWFDGSHSELSNRRQPGWYIHGLWPETCEECLNCGYPSYCRKVHFNGSSIHALSQKIKKRWFPGKNLIKHEWVKHGSCDGNVTEYDYFNKTLNLWDCIPFKQECLNSRKECRLLLQANQIQKCNSVM